ncbi:MAG: hypothetical protein EOO68_31585 [Moraxellaceae bacterium]|nr:MAG: hypothetical protein EOO68_31585 [Moraxellaceae bacterium]
MLALIQFHQFTIQYGQLAGHQYSMLAVKSMHASYTQGMATPLTNKILDMFREDVSCLEARNQLLKNTDGRIGAAAA